MQTFLAFIKARFGASFSALSASFFVVLVCAPSARSQTNGSPSVTYVGGQLKIDALDVTLADVLNRVTALTGVKFDIPVEANTQRMAVLKLGPGPAREVLASLLSGSHLNYLIQQSEGDPEKIQAVLIMAPEKKGTKPGVAEANMQASNSPYRRAAELAAKVEEPSIPAAVTPAAAVSGPDTQSPDPTTPETAPPATTQPEPSTQPRPGAMNPPAVLSPQSINQQLQQMYQQRMQINQQTHAAPVSASAGN